jgi:hypothetical protein
VSLFNSLSTVLIPQPPTHYEWHQRVLLIARRSTWSVLSVERSQPCLHLRRRTTTARHKERCSIAGVDLVIHQEEHLRAYGVRLEATTVLWRFVEFMDEHRQRHETVQAEDDVTSIIKPRVRSFMGLVRVVQPQYLGAGVSLIRPD